MAKYWETAESRGRRTGRVTLEGDEDVATQPEALGLGVNTILTSVSSFWFQSLGLLRACHQAHSVSWEAWIPILRLYWKSIRCCSIMKTQSCFS